MDLFTYLLKKKGHNSSVNGDLFSYLLASRKRGTYQTYTGTQINVIDSVNLRMKNWILGGNTSQDGTPTPEAPVDIHVVKGENNILENEGKNLLNPASIEQRTNGGIKCTYNEETQEITFNGICTADNTTFNFLGEIVEAIQSVTTASVHYVSGSVTGYCNFRAYNNEYVGNISFSINDLSNNNKIDYKTSNYNDTLSRISFRFNAGAIADNLKIKVMIANTTNTEYEKYKGKNYKVSLSSKNLFNTKDCLRGASYNYGTTGIIPTPTNSNARITLPPQYAIKVKPNTKYTFNMNTTDFDFALAELQSDKKTNQDSGWKNGNLTITTKNNTNYIAFNFRKHSGNWDEITDEVWNDFLNCEAQLEENDTATPYVPYLNIELCKIGDYQDKIYKSNDKWYLEKNINKIQLLSSFEWWLAQTNENTLRFGCRELTNGLVTSNMKIICNRFKNGTSTTDNTDNEHIRNAIDEYPTFLFVNINKTTASDMDEWKEWLNNNETIVYYILNNPVITEITNEILLQQLNELAKAKSFNGQTNITQISEDLPFDLSVDIKTQ